MQPCRAMPMRNVPAGAAILCAILGALACNGELTPTPSAPTQPTTPPVDVTGTWSGPAADSSGPGQMTWRLTQASSAINGTLAIHDTDTGVNGQGSITGTVAGSSISFSIAIAAGGFEAPFATCMSSVSGTATVSSPTITGTYTGSNSCTGPISAGQLTLNKQ